MFNPQYSSSFFSYFPHQPPTSNATSIDSLFLSFRQPVNVITSALPSDSSLHPPGTEPCPKPGSSSSSPYPLTQYYQDPNAGPPTWVVQQVDPLAYESAVKSSNRNQVAALGGQSYQYNNNTWRNQQPLVHDPPFQPVRCEVCNISCYSKYVYEKHVLGKKHMKNLETQINPLTANLAGTTTYPGGVASFFGTSQDVEVKKLNILKSGASVDSVRVCTICNVACNSQEVFNKHLTGKKHAAQTGLIALNPYVAAIRSHYDSTQKKYPKKIKFVQPAWCEVCKINCNSCDVYAKHLSGKKHLKNLEILEKSKNNALPSSTSNSIIGPVEKGKEVGKSKTLRNEDLAQEPEELKMKVQKIVESGVEARYVRMCTICNVVCNSQTVFDFHLAGQKHIAAAMLKK